MPELDKTTCCGLRQFTHIEELGVLESMKAMSTQFFESKLGLILFTFKKNSKTHKKLIEYILTRELGTIMQTESVAGVVAAVWAINPDNLFKWHLENCTIYEIGDIVKVTELARKKYGLTDEGEHTVVAIRERSYVDVRNSRGAVDSYYPSTLYLVERPIPVDEPTI